MCRVVLPPVGNESARWRQSTRPTTATTGTAFTVGCRLSLPRSPPPARSTGNDGRPRFTRFAARARLRNDDNPLVDDVDRTSQHRSPNVRRFSSVQSFVARAVFAIVAVLSRGPRHRPRPLSHDRSIRRRTCRNVCELGHDAHTYTHRTRPGKFSTDTLSFFDRVGSTDSTSSPPPVPTAPEHELRNDGKLAYRFS